MLILGKKPAFNLSVKVHTTRSAIMLWVGCLPSASCSCWGEASCQYVFCQVFYLDRVSNATFVQLASPSFHYNMIKHHCNELRKCYANCYMHKSSLISSSTCSNVQHHQWQQYEVDKKQMERYCFLYKSPNTALLRSNNTAVIFTAIRLMLGSELQRK